MVAFSRKSLKGGQFALKNTREDPGMVSQDRKSPRTGGRPTSFYCIQLHFYKNIEEIHTLAVGGTLEFPILSHVLLRQDAQLLWKHS